MAGSVHVYVSSGQLQTVKLQFNKTESSYLLFLECSPQNSCFFLCAAKIAAFVYVDAARKANVYSTFHYSIANKFKSSYVFYTYNYNI